MKLRLILNRQLISNFNIQLWNIIKKNTAPGRYNIHIISPGGDGYYPYRFNNKSSLWASNDVRNNKIFNAFGFEVNENSSNRMTVQINYQPKFRDFSEAAVWAQDTESNIYLLHSGKMGGGVKGIKKEKVFDHFTGEKVEILYEEKTHPFMIVCCLNSLEAYQQIEYFVNEIRRIKPILKLYTPNPRITSGKFNLKKYSPEFFGKKSYEHFGGRISSVANHGLIVDELKNIIKEYGEPVNNREIDLGLIKKGKPKVQFEIKTNCSTQSIYTAVGQLMLHSRKIGTQIKKVFIAPNEIGFDVIMDLERLGITTIKYGWKSKKPIFDKAAQKELDKICNQF